jgi:hypothetical protein
MDQNGITLLIANRVTKARKISSNFIGHPAVFVETGAAVARPW